MRHSPRRYMIPINPCCFGRTGDGRTSYIRSTFLFFHLFWLLLIFHYTPISTEILVSFSLDVIRPVVPSPFPRVPFTTLLSTPYSPIIGLSPPPPAPQDQHSSLYTLAGILLPPRLYLDVLLHKRPLTLVDFNTGVEPLEVSQLNFFNMKQNRPQSFERHFPVFIYAIQNTRRVGDGINDTFVLLT